MQWIDKTYIMQLSSRLDKFVQKSENLFNARCPLCGDSSDHPNKKRFFIYLKGNDYRVHCHNCGYNSQFSYFLKVYDTGLYHQYQMDVMKEKGTDKKVFSPTTKFRVQTGDYLKQLRELMTIKQLENNHPTKRYVEERKIPETYYSVLRWCPAFMSWTNSLLPDKFPKIGEDEGRIVIPYFTTNNDFFAYSGRAIGLAKSKYISISLKPQYRMIYGLDKVDLIKNMYVLEGPFDSMFLPNAIALSGGNLGDLTSLGTSDKFIVVFDNEPRKPETKRKVLGAINRGFAVCIWPCWIIHKDINQMVQHGWSTKYIKEVLDKETYSGLEAKIKLEERYV